MVEGMEISSGGAMIVAIVIVILCFLTCGIGVVLMLGGLEMF